MKISEIIKALRRNMVETGSLICVGCGREHNCSIHGCAIMREAADALERLSTEKRDTDAHLKAISDSLSEQLRRTVPGNKRPIDAVTLSEEIQHLQIFLAGESVFTPAIKETVLRTIDEQPTVAVPENDYAALKAKYDEINHYNISCTKMIDELLAEKVAALGNKALEFNPLQGKCFGCVWEFADVEHYCKGCIRYVSAADFTDKYIRKPEGEKL